MAAIKEPLAAGTENAKRLKDLTKALPWLWNNSSDDTKNMIAREVLIYDLETIARDRPLLNPRTNKTTELEAVLADIKGKGKAPVVPAIFATPAVPALPRAGAKRAAGAAALDLTAAAGAEGVNNDPEAEFRKLKREKKDSMRFHEAENHTGEWPGPTAGLRFKIDAYRKEMGFGKLLSEIANRSSVTSAQELYSIKEASDLDNMEWWLQKRNRGGPSLVKGLPLVENVTFLRHANLWDMSKEEGEIGGANCYWTATAMLIYGNPWMWLRVKADHREHFGRVLRNSGHPKNELYTAFNKKWYKTPALGNKGSTDLTVNLWQVLSLPGLYTPAVMADITADLYNVYAVMFSYNSNEHPNLVYETRTRGAYNSRHIFYLFTGGCHFQPMVPNEYIHWEFRYPRVNQRGTKDFPLSGDGKKDGIQHPWRSEFRSFRGQQAPSVVGRYHSGHNDTQDPNLHALFCRSLGIDPAPESTE